MAALSVGLGCVCLPDCHVLLEPFRQGPSAIRRVRRGRPYWPERENQKLLTAASCNFRTMGHGSTPAGMDGSICFCFGTPQTLPVASCNSYIEFIEQALQLLYPLPSSFGRVCGVYIYIHAHVVSIGLATQQHRHTKDGTKHLCCNLAHHKTNEHHKHHKRNNKRTPQTKPQTSTTKETINEHHKRNHKGTPQMKQ